MAELGGKQVEVDELGFVQDRGAWDEAVAASIAELEGVLTLTEEHWKVLRCLREHHAEHGLAPRLRILCKTTGFTLKKIYQLFPSGPAKGACKVAGLPSSAGCA